MGAAPSTGATRAPAHCAEGPSGGSIVDDVRTAVCMQRMQEEIRYDRTFDCRLDGT